MYILFFVILEIFEQILPDEFHVEFIIQTIDITQIQPPRDRDVVTAVQPADFILVIKRRGNFVFPVYPI